jgi:hypothetical protein
LKKEKRKKAFRGSIIPQEEDFNTYTKTHTHTQFTIQIQSKVDGGNFSCGLLIGA